VLKVSPRPAVDRSLR